MFTCMYVCFQFTSGGHTPTPPHTHTQPYAQVHLFDCLRLLTDTQRSAISADTALTTLSTTLALLPSSLLSTTDCVQAITTSWAKTKELVNSEIKGASSSTSMLTTPSNELLGRTIVEAAHTLSDSVKILYLEGELKAGKTW